MVKLIQFVFMLFILLSTTSCNISKNAGAGAVSGMLIVGPIGAVVAGSIVADQPIQFNEFKRNEVLKIEFKDREFLESQITDIKIIHRIVSQIKESSVVDPVQGNFYRTVELVLTDDRVVRIGINDSYFKNGNTYYQMGKELNEEINKHF